MELRLPFLLLASVILAGALSIAIVDAQQGTMLSVQTNIAEYRTGDTVVIAGKVAPVVAGEQVIIRVLSPMGALTRIDPVNVTADGSYSYSYIIAGPLNLLSGDYRAAATYVGLTRESNFRFISLDPNWQSYLLKVGGRSYEIQYAISGGSVQTIASDPSLATTTVGITSESNGELLLRLPILLAFHGYAYSLNVQSTGLEFIGFTDGIEAIVETKDMLCQSQLAMRFEKDTEIIELVSPIMTEGLELYSNHTDSFVTTVPIKAEGEEFDLRARLNADSCNFSFIQSKRTLHAELSGQESPGYFEITLPHRFLGGEYAVLLAGEPTTNFNMTYNPGLEDSTTIALNYDPQNVKSIDIIGTTVIPEFGRLAITIMAASLLGMTVILRLAKHGS